MFQAHFILKIRILIILELYFLSKTNDKYIIGSSTEIYICIFCRLIMSFIIYLVKLTAGEIRNLQVILYLKLTLKSRMNKASGTFQVADNNLRDSDLHATGLRLAIPR